MDHAIMDLVDRMHITIEMYSHLPKEEIQEEIQAYINAINELEKYYYGEARTRLDYYL